MKGFALVLVTLLMVPSMAEAQCTNNCFTMTVSNSIFAQPAVHVQAGRTEVIVESAPIVVAAPVAVTARVVCANGSCRTVARSGPRRVFIRTVSRRFRLFR